MSDEVWLSQSAYDALAAELEELKTEGRPRASKEIEVARAHGDLRENAEYHAAKEAQGMMEARIRQLEAMLRDAKVGDSPTGDTVAPGMIVTTKDSDGDTDTFLLGSREERTLVDEGTHVISPQSPLGKALLGAKKGQTVTYEAPAGSFSITIIDAKPAS